ncbi:MAG: MFS transporter [Methanobacteriota archaeon]|nr:MAG: MFS transporter [Euryarchaeota archaeon]
MKDTDEGCHGFRRIRETFALSRDFVVLVFALVVVSLGFGLLGPLMPTFREILGMSEAELGGAYSLFAFSFVFALPPAGLLADKVGRKRMIISGVLLFGVTTYALVLITEPYQFALLRIMEGVGAAMVTPAAFALTLDIVPEGKRGLAMGAEGTAQLLGGLAGPALGGLIAGEIGFYVPFYFAAALAIACAVIVTFIREPKIRRSKDETVSITTMFSAWKRNAAENNALLPLTVRGFVMGIVQGLWALGLIMFWEDKLDMSHTEVGIALSLGMATMAIGTIPFGVMSDKYGRKRFILIGGALMAGGLAAMAFVTETWHVYALVAFSEFGAAISNPSVGAMLGDVMNQKERGRVMGAYQTVQGVGNIVGFSALGLMYERISPRAPILSCAGALAAATTIIALFVDETHQSEKKDNSEESPTGKVSAKKRDAAVSDNPEPQKPG